MLLSLIIPVYNVEKHIESCLNSVISQNHDDMEVICINDGSTDRSKDILNKYSEKVSNLVIISQENEGLSGARNTGIINANGKWVMFLDSDDKLEEEFIDGLIVFLRKYDNCDLVEYEYKTVYPNGAIRRNCDFSKIKNVYKTGKEIFANKIKTNTFYFSAWNKVLKNNFLKDNRIFFRERVLYEDIEFSTKAINKARKINFYNKVGTIYYKRNGGTITTTRSIRNLERMNSYSKMIEVLQEYNLDILYKDFFKEYMIKKVVEVFYDVANNSKNLNEFKDILKHRKNYAELKEYIEHGLKNSKIKTKLLLKSLKNYAILFFLYSKVHYYLKLKYFRIRSIL